MKVEKNITIDGRIVNKVFKKDCQTVYQAEMMLDDSDVTLFFVDNRTGDVIFKLVVDASYNQGLGFISSVEFEEVSVM